MATRRICDWCGGTNTYVSKNGYNTVIVCRTCWHEWYAPYEDEDARERADRSFRNILQGRDW